MRFVLSLFAFSLCAIAQTAAPDPSIIPSIALPAGIVATVNYDQLGSPRITGGFGAIYPIVGSVGVYGVSGAEFYPRLATDPASGKSFYALQVTVQQEVHKSIWASGRATFLLGVGAGPAITSTPPQSGATNSPLSGLQIAVSTDVVSTAVVRLSKTLSAVFSVKGLYINGAGWNLVPRIGIKFDLSKAK